MSGVVVTYRVKFGGGPRTNSGDAKNPATVATEDPKPAPEPTLVPPEARTIPGLARRLALAYFVERRIEDGTFRDAAHAAEVFGVTRPRMSQCWRCSGSRRRSRSGFSRGS